MSDELRDTWFYQEILKEGREQGHGEGIEEGIEKGAAIIKDPKILQDLIVKVGAAQTAEEAQDYLLSWEEAS